jgi:hypothetical protein
VKGTELLNLRRFWFPRARESTAYWSLHTFSPADDDGIIHPALQLAPLAQLLAKPCLFLLGRPGAGKTAEYLTHFQSANLPGESLLACEPRHLDGAGADSLFRGDAWQQVLAVGKPIRVVFDSVDEALLGRGAFLDGLLHQLGLAKSAAQSRGLALSVVLTCRLAEWGDEVGEEIAGLWGLRAQECAFELAPLSYRAALDLARSRNVGEPEALASAWRKADMSSYACWPRTLIWLADEFAREQRISSTLTELHARRCERQFDERLQRQRTHSPETIARWNDAIELLACASITTGAQRFVIGPAAGERELDLSAFAAALAKMPRRLPSRELPTAQVFQDALAFAELIERTSGGWMFREQSDAEFLAARRFSHFPVEELAAFFASETGYGWQVFPQLATTAAMLAVHSKDFRCWLLEHDPLVLLRTDFAALPQADKAAAVDALLDLIASGAAPDADDHPAHLHTLAHDGLAAQLRPWLADHRRPLVAREMALRIAAECADEKLRGELSDAVWELARGPEADTLATLPYAIAEIGVAWPKARLLTLANGELPAGRHWSSRGTALFALFDRRRSALPAAEQALLSEVVPHFMLNPTGVSSRYDWFLQSCHEFLQGDDVDEVLRLLATLDRWSELLGDVEPYKTPPIAILRAVCAHIPKPAATNALAAWWLDAIARDHMAIPGEACWCSLAEVGLDDDAKRQALLLAIIQHPGASAVRDIDIQLLPHEPADFPWLLALLPQCAGSEEKIAARLVCQHILRRRLREENLAAVRLAHAASPELRALLPPAPEGYIHEELIRLQTEQEKRWAANDGKLQRRMSREPKADAEQEIASALDACLKGEINRWPWLLEAAGRVQPEGSQGRIWEATSPDELPGWSRIAEQDRAALRKTAKHFLLRYPLTLPGRNQSNLGVEATRHSLSLLRENLSTDPELCAGFRSEWVEVVLRALHPDRAPLPAVLAALHAMNPEATLAGIRKQVEYDAVNDRYLLAEYLDPLLSDRDCARALWGIFEEVLSRFPIHAQSYRTGVTCLLRRDRKKAAAFVLQRCDALAGEEPSDTRRIILGTALLAFPEHWQRVWPLISADAKEGLQCLAWVACASEHLGWQEAMFAEVDKHAEFIAELYGWLLKHLPPEPKRTGTYTPGGFDHCRDLERECYRALFDAGHSRLLRRAFYFAGIADVHWTRRVARKSERIAYARQWHPWQPAHFAEWLTSEGGTRITDADSLLRAIESSLRRFGEVCKGMPSHHLWDEKTKVPLREKALSNELAIHLRSDLRLIPRDPAIFINREPQFFSGEPTDLHIQAQLPNGAVATVIVEVKLCDHPDVEKAMASQLAERYLRQKGLTHGLYFVGWFTCGVWPKKKKPFQSLGAARARHKLAKQAASLSKSDLRIRAVLSECPLHRAKPKKASASQRHPPRMDSIRSSKTAHGTATRRR